MTPSKTATVLPRIGAIRKVFIPGGLAGSSRPYWEHEWENADIASALALAQLHPSPILRRLRDCVPRQGLVLEAGCGSAAVVAYLRELGCNVVGMDYAISSLVAAKDQVASLPLVAGDVSRFPFCDGVFDCVTSLGVVEHFEGGPGEVLQEHRRILRPGGLLLLTAPALSLVKRWNDWWNLGVRMAGAYTSRRRVVTRVTDLSFEESSLSGEQRTFHQYEFPKRLVRDILHRAHFKVDSASLILTSSGIGESRLVQGIAQSRTSLAARRSTQPSDGPARLSPASRAMTFVKAQVLDEEAEGVVGRVLTRLSQEFFGHMVFVVARAE